MPKNIFSLLSRLHNDIVLIWLNANNSSALTPGNHLLHNFSSHRLNSHLAKTMRHLTYFPRAVAIYANTSVWMDAAST